MSQPLNIDTTEYTDLDIIKGNDGYITPNATFLIVRNSNMYSKELTHENWAKGYVREKEIYDVFTRSNYNEEYQFLEQDLKYIRYANINIMVNSLKGNDLWDIYKDYENGKYPQEQLEFLKEVCRINASEMGIAIDIKQK